MTALPLSVESQLRARLDFEHPLPLEGLTSYCGCSSAEYAMRYGLDRGDLAPIEKRSKPRRVLKGRRSVCDTTV